MPPTCLCHFKEYDDEFSLIMKKCFIDVKNDKIKSTKLFLKLLHKSENLYFLHFSLASLSILKLLIYMSIFYTKKKLLFKTFLHIFSYKTFILRQKIFLLKEISFYKELNC